MAIKYLAGERIIGTAAERTALSTGTDTMGTGANGTAISDPTFVASGDTNGVAMPSGLGLKSYYFDGNDAINIDGAIGFSASSNTVGSISFWYYNTHDQEGKVILAFGDANASTYMKFPTRYNTTDKILGHNSDTSGNNWEIRNHANDAGDDLADDTWHHMCCVQDGTAVKLYINSILLTVWNDQTDKSEWIKSGIDSARIGCDMDTNSTNGNFLTGNVTEVALWNVALTSAQATSLYNSGNGAKASTIPSGLRAYYDGSSLNNAAVTVYPNLSNGTIFEESDTGKHQMFDGTSAWNEMS